MISHLSQFLSRLLPAAKQRLRDLVKPDNYALAANVMADLTRSKTELILENVACRAPAVLARKIHPFQSERRVRYCHSDLFVHG